MLEYIHVHNFMCISDLKIDLSYKDKAPAGYKRASEIYFFEHRNKTKNRVSPVFAMYGANGSGKSTIINAIKCLKNILANGLKMRYYIPNRIIDNDKSLTYTELCIAFWKDSNRFKYSIKFNEDSIVKESLILNNELIFNISESQLLDVINSDSDANSEFLKRCINAKTKKQIKTFLFIIPETLPGFNKALLEAKEYILQDLSVYSSNNEQNYISGINKLANTYQGTDENNQKDAISCIIDYLGRLDIGIIDISVNKSLLKDYFKNLKNKNLIDLNFHINKMAFNEDNENKDIYIYDTYTYHKTVSNNIVNFDINYESEGTKIVIGLLGEFLAAIRTGKVILIDELDESLHSLLVKELVNLFKTKRINENGAQIIFTAHNPEILDILNPNEVGIVNYRKSKGSVVTKISEFGIKVKKGYLRDAYLKGTFGGIPFPYV